MNGYSHLVEFGPGHPMQEGRDYVVLDQNKLRRSRNTRGIMIGTARTNPGKDVSHPSHLADPNRTAPLRTVYEALRSLGVDALVSIGGDDTLKTANKFKLFQAHLSQDEPRIAVVHVPKTIDNDYKGIDFTFGYFTAVETLANEIRNLLADAEATRSYFIAECMGRSAGWLAYGAFAHQHQVHGELAARGLESHERGEERVLGSLLVDRAAPHAHGAEPLLLYQPPLERRGAPLLGHELLDVVHEIDADRGACAGVDRSEHAGLARSRHDLHPGEAGLARQLRHVLRPLRVVAVLGRDRGQRDPVLQALDVGGVHLRDPGEHRCLVRAPGSARAGRQRSERGCRNGSAQEIAAAEAGVDRHRITPCRPVGNRPAKYQKRMAGFDRGLRS